MHSAAAGWPAILARIPNAHPEHEPIRAARFIDSPVIPVVLLTSAFVGILALLVIASVGPLATDDLWWHLSLGRAYAASGPFLTGGEPLHTAVSAPPPSAWLFDLSLHAWSRVGSLAALRVLHLGWVCAIVVLVWSWLRRLSDSGLFASAATALFVGASSYRLLQLRPELATILAAVALITLLIDPMRMPGWRRIGIGAVVCALWANAHPGFLLGPILLWIAAAGALGISLVGARSDSEARRTLRERGTRYAMAGVLSLLATLLNPDGLYALSAYVGAGVDSVGRAVVVDEWRALDLFSFPVSNLPPTPLPWVIAWCSTIAVVVVAGAGLGAWLRSGSGSREQSRIDPALIALGLAGVCAPLIAVRFVWLVFLPLGLLAVWWREHASAQRTMAWIPALVTVATLPAYYAASDWTLVTRSWKADRYFSEAYDADRYYGHLAWFLRDSGVQGRLFHPYFMGGFLGYWLGPSLETYVDGSLNFPDEVLETYHQIQVQGQPGPAVDLTELLDRREVDFFVGVGLPAIPRPHRPWRYTTAYLERSEDWILVFRGMRGAVYLRDHARNAANLRLIAEYYAAEGVPFDAARGFEAERVIELATPWAIEHGVAPTDYRALVKVAERASIPKRSIARDRLASTWAALGIYDRAIELDEREARRDGGSDANLRRRLWTRVRMDDGAAARDLGDRLRQDARPDASSASLIALAEGYARADEGSGRDRMAAMATLFGRVRAARLKRSEVRAEARVR